MKNWFLALLLLAACAPPSLNNTVTVSEIEAAPSTEEMFRVARTSFLKIEKEVTFYDCIAPPLCLPVFSGKSTGSSVVVKNYEEGSLVFTAAHLCDLKDDLLNKVKKELKDHPTEIKVDLKFELVDIEGRRYDNIEILYKDINEDICGIYVSGLDRRAMEIAQHSPAYGETVYNIAAPHGLFLEFNPVLYTGIYFGNAVIDTVAGAMGKERNSSLFSIPTAGGSSGSPVLNKHGELISIIHSHHTKLSSVGYGSQLKVVKNAYNFINEPKKN